MSTVAVAMQSQGYQRANQRAACCRCRHGKEYSIGMWRCTLGEFRVTAMSVCTGFEQRQEPHHG